MESLHLQPLLAPYSETTPDSEDLGLEMEVGMGAGKLEGGAVPSSRGAIVAPMGKG